MVIADKQTFDRMKEENRLLISAGNYLSLVEMGMSEAAAQRMGKRWDDKCAQADNLRAALADAPDIAFYQPDEFFKLYTEWFEKRRSSALKNGERT